MVHQNYKNFPLLQNEVGKCANWKPNYLTLPNENCALHICSLPFANLPLNKQSCTKFCRVNKVA